MELRVLRRRRPAGIAGCGGALVAIAAAALLGGCASTGESAGSVPAGPAAPSDRGGATSAPEDPGIRATLDALNAICAARDVDAFMRLFDDGDDVLLVGSDAGEVFRGRRAIRGFVTQMYALPFRFSFDVSRTTVSRHGDVAWVFVDGEMIHTGDQGGAAGRVTHAPYRIAIVMVRRTDGWRWRLFHGSTPGGGA